MYGEFYVSKKNTKKKHPIGEHVISILQLKIDEFIAEYAL